MNKHLLILAASVLLSGGAGAQEEANNEVASLQGAWVVISAEVGGKSLDFLKGKEFIFAGTTIKGKNKKGDDQVLYTYAIDPTKTPKEIDLVLKNSKIAGGKAVLRGIYTRQGDSLKICNGTYSEDRVAGTVQESKRPTEFKSTKDCDLLLLKRKKR